MVENKFRFDSKKSKFSCYVEVMSHIHVECDCLYLLICGGRRKDFRVRM